MSIKVLATIKKCLTLLIIQVSQSILINQINYSTKSKYFDKSNKLVVSKIKDETVAAAIKGFVQIEAKNVFVFGR